MSEDSSGMFCSLSLDAMVKSNTGLQHGLSHCTDVPRIQYKASYAQAELSCNSLSRTPCSLCMCPSFASGCSSEGNKVRGFWKSKMLVMDFNALIIDAQAQVMDSKVLITDFRISGVSGHMLLLF